VSQAKTDLLPARDSCRSRKACGSSTRGPTWPGTSHATTGGRPAVRQPTAAGAGRCEPAGLLRGGPQLRAPDGARQARNTLNLARVR